MLNECSVVGIKTKGRKKTNELSILLCARNNGQRGEIRRIEFYVYLQFALNIKHKFSCWECIRYKFVSIEN